MNILRDHGAQLQHDHVRELHVATRETEPRSPSRLASGVFGTLQLGVQDTPLSSHTLSLWDHSCSGRVILCKTEENMDASTVGRYGTLHLLKRLDPSSAVASYPIDEEEITIGRDPSCSIRLYYESVSMLHCKIIFRERKVRHRRLWPSCRLTILFCGLRRHLLRCWVPMVS